MSQLMLLIFTVLWFEQSLFICNLLLGEACLERRVQVPSDLLYIRLSSQISICFFLYLKVKLILSRHQEWIFGPRAPSIFVHGIVSQRTGINYNYHTCIHVSLHEVNKVQLTVKIKFKPRIKLNHNI